MAVHQWAHFCNDPKVCHKRAVKQIDCYLLGTKQCGIICNPNQTWVLESFADADFAGGCDCGNSDDPENVMSRTGYIIYMLAAPLFSAASFDRRLHSLLQRQSTFPHHKGVGTSLPWFTWWMSSSLWSPSIIQHHSISASSSRMIGSASWWQSWWDSLCGPNTLWSNTIILGSSWWVVK